MRIVGGALSGRRFAGPAQGRTRPTAERVREALGSILEARGALRSAVVLDLFAGTGALAFEMLSRGAARAVLVDRDRRAVGAMRRSARQLGLDAVRVLRWDLRQDASRSAARLRASAPFSLVLADPPWAEAALVPPLLLSLVRADVITPPATLVIEHAARSTPALPGGLAKVGSYRYGDTAILIATPGDDPA